jgi:transcriptional regulator with XRE-family HTH domain
MELKFSKILAQRLKGKNLSALAKELEMPRSMLHDWVRGKRIPSLNNIEYIKLLADHLGISLEELLTGEKDDKKIISSILFQDDSRQYKIQVERIK